MLGDSLRVRHAHWALGGGLRWQQMIRIIRPVPPSLYYLASPPWTAPVWAICPNKMILPDNMPIPYRQRDCAQGPAPAALTVGLVLQKNGAIFT